MKLSITKEQLYMLIKLGTSDGLEFKSNFHSYQEISKVLCAFGNTHGGIVMIGIDDKGNVVGNKKSKDEIQKSIVASIHAISPHPQVAIQLIDIDNTYIAVVIVHKPVRSTYYTFQGAIYVRTGSVTHKLEGNSMQHFLQNKCALPFDGCIATNADIASIDKEKVAAYLHRREQYDYFATHTIKDFLVSSQLALVIETQCITYAALLLFGKSPQNFLPQSEIKLVHFAGEEAVEILSYKLVNGDIFEQIRESIEFVKNHISRSIIIDGNPQRTEHYEYPLSVIREVIINAIVHRDYSNVNAIQINIFNNRIEVINPGSFPSDIPQDMFGSISIQRNPLLYTFLRNINYVEGIGSGVPRIKSAMRKAGLPDPVFRLMKSFFKVELYNKQANKEGVSEHQVSSAVEKRAQKGTEYIKKKGKITTQEYASLNEISSSSALKDLKKLREDGIIKKCGEYKNAYYILAADNSV